MASRCTQCDYTTYEPFKFCPVDGSALVEREGIEQTLSCGCVLVAGYWEDGCTEARRLTKEYARLNNLAARTCDPADREARTAARQKMRDHRMEERH